MEKSEASCAAGGKAKWYKQFGHNLAISRKKVKNRIIIGCSNSTPRIIPKIKENICLHKNLFSNVHSGIIHKSQ